MKWKLSTSALLASVAGIVPLTPIRAIAQQTSPADASGQPATMPVISSAAYDPSALLSGAIPGASQAQRDEAARRLLSRRTAQSRQTLHDALVAVSDQGGQLAVARALDQDPDPDPSFIDPLFPLLESRELAAAAGRALAGYKSNPTVLTRLIGLSSARRTSAEFTRIAAIRAIGTIPEKRGADMLTRLLVSSDESPAIHKAAAEALNNLTGLDQNGEDAARWMKWWNAARIKPDTEFRQEIEALRDARLDRLDTRYRGLIGEVETLLREEYYKTKSLPERQDLMLKFLASSEPEVRQIGTRLLSGDVLEGNQLALPELQQLRQMISDSDAGVRRAVADAVSRINDAAASKPLLDQLKVEPDPTVRAAIARALGPIHDLSAVPTLMKLLSDDSLQTAEAAANALGDLAHDKLPGDPKQSRETAVALSNAILSNGRTPGADELRAACIEALAPLQQKDIIQDLLDRKLTDWGKEDSVEVRRAMLEAIGALNDPKLAEPVVNSLYDPASEVQVQAIRELGKNPRAAEFAQTVGNLLKPNPAIDQSVRDEAWKFLQGIFPFLSEPQLANWAEQLKDIPGRQLIALKALADKQQSAGEFENLATTRADIGEANMALKQFDAAAKSYGAALKTYDDLPANPSAQALLQSLIRNYLEALLADGKYSDAIKLAADRIRLDSSEQSNLGPVIANKAEELNASARHDDLVGAKNLVDQAAKMSPKLDGKYQDRLKAVADAIQKRTSSIDGASPIPQSATADGK